MWVYDKQPLPCSDQSNQALVVQTIVSLKTLLKRQLVKYIPTTGSKTLLFLLEKCENILHSVSVILYILNFIDMLTNDVVNFQQLIPEH